MGKKYIIHFYEFSIPKADIEAMPSTEVAFLGTLAFAVDEIVTFEKLLVQSFNHRPSADELLGLYQVQQNVLMRSLNAKIFEALKVLKDYKELAERESASDRAEKVAHYLGQLETFLSGETYDLARTIRNHATNHYVTSETKKNLKNLSDKAKFVAYVHKNSGNSYYPFGEETVFLARIGRHFSEHGRDTYAIEDLKKWIDWGLGASKIITRSLQDYLLWLHKEKYPNWKLRKISPYLEEELWGEVHTASIPIILDADEYQRAKRDENG